VVEFLEADGTAITHPEVAVKQHSLPAVGTAPAETAQHGRTDRPVIGGGMVMLHRG
jgi:hypothetical protein